MDVESISWHPGFAEGLRETYIKYSDGLEFKDEFQLAKEPLRIDVVIVKKRPDLIVDTDTGRIFRGHNIFEYKSPGDYASVSDFQKSCAYVWLYSVESKADISDITLSFVVTSHPKALLNYCTEHLSYAVEEKYPGIYYVTGGVVPIQVIVSPKLSGEEALWLGSLRADLNASDMEKLLRVSIERTVYKRRPTFLNVILAANPNILQEVREMIMTQGLREALIDLGLAAEWERQGIEQGKIEDALAMINEGLSIELAAKITGIPAERLECLLLSGTGNEE
jgi:hypothetical protein